MKYFVCDADTNRYSLTWPPWEAQSSAQHGECVLRKVCDSSPGRKGKTLERSTWKTQAQTIRKEKEWKARTAKLLFDRSEQRWKAVQKAYWCFVSVTFVSACEHEAFGSRSTSCPWKLQQRKPWLVLTMQKFIPQHGLLLHHIHRDFYSGDIFMVGVIRLWEEGGRTSTG